MLIKDWVENCVAKPTKSINMVYFILLLFDELEHHLFKFELDTNGGCSVESHKQRGNITIKFNTEKNVFVSIL